MNDKLMLWELKTQLERLLWKLREKQIRRALETKYGSAVGRGKARQEEEASDDRPEGAVWNLI